MNRREFLEKASRIPMLSALGPLAARFAGSAAPPFRRVRPSDPEWPSAEAWARLRQQVGGRLIAVPPILEPCTGASDMPSAACAARIEEMANPYFIGEQPAGTQTSGWLDAWTSSPSVYAVEAKTAEDVAAAVLFARNNRLRLVVKGGGHSYQGTSNAPDSLLVWTRAMHAITIHDAFVPRGSSARPRPAVTVEAGCRWLPTYDRVTTSAGRYVQGGGCCTVGVAGLIQSGGFGSFSKNFGLAAAGLLEAEVVTADGRIRIANAASDPELFWGLKGGGGGSLGVVTTLTLATHPLPQFFGWAEGKVQAKSDAAFRKLILEFLRFYARSLMNPAWGEQATFGPDNSLTIRMVCCGLTTPEARAAWKPFSELVDASPDDYAFTETLSVDTMPARHWWDPEWRRKNDADSVIADPRPGAPPGNIWWAGNMIEVNIYLYGYESIWLPAALLDSPARLADALFASSRQLPMMLHCNKGLAGAPTQRIAEARDTATNPAALDAFALAIVAMGKPHAAPGMPGHEPDPVEGRKQAAAVTASAEALRALVPDAGAYVSESNYFDKSFQRSYWGANYPRLLAAKKRYDPEGLFFVHNGVGSEDWSPDGFTRLRQG
jgi:FAD/FMN-containing dehydrogenase